MLTAEQYRKMAESAGRKVIKWAVWPRDYPDGECIDLVPSDAIVELGGKGFFEADGLPWHPEADLNQLAEWLESVGVKRGWTKTCTERDHEESPEHLFLAFRAYENDAGNVLDCKGVGSTEPEAKINAVIGGADDAG